MDMISSTNADLGMFFMKLKRGVACSKSELARTSPNRLVVGELNGHLVGCLLGWFSWLLAWLVGRLINSWLVCWLVVMKEL